MHQSFSLEPWPLTINDHGFFLYFLAHLFMIVSYTTATKKAFGLLWKQLLCT